MKPPALEPQYKPRRKRYETSTHRSDGLPEDRIWALGYDYVENAEANRRIRARAIGLAAIVTDQNLRWAINGEPYPRHADIVGWAAGTEKSVRMMAAIEIAERMRLQIDPRP